MSNIDFLNINGNILRQFLVVLEEGSVTKAARRLNIGQSAVSHSLENMRRIAEDPLFVRTGRGVTPTARAIQLGEEIRPIIDALHQLTVKPEFDPAKYTGTVTIGASDMSRELLVPPLARIMRSTMPDLDLRVVDASTNIEEQLRNDKCDIIISPALPDGTEFIKKKIFTDEWVCFRDPATQAPNTMEQYLARNHAKVVFSDSDYSMIDSKLEELGHKRRIRLRVGSFYSLVSLIRDTEIIITLPSLIKNSIMKEFVTSPIPFEFPLMDFNLLWHLRNNTNPFHRWLRTELGRLSRKIGR